MLASPVLRAHRLKDSCGHGPQGAADTLKRFISHAQVRVNMLYMTSFNVKEGRVREFQTWVKKNEDVMQKSAPRGWTYRGTYGYVLGFGRYGGAQLWECNKYGDFDAWREHSDHGRTRNPGEVDGFLSGQTREFALPREMGDVTVCEAKKPKT